MQNLVTKEELFTRAAVDEILLWNTEHFHDARKLFLLVFAWEDRETGVQLCQNAT